MKTEQEEQLKAEMYCSAGEHCRSEVAAKLAGNGRRDSEPLAPEAVERILAHLEKEGYIDEERYARAFVHDKLEFCRWGKIRIRMALRQKGIGNAAAENALASVDEDEYTGILRDVLAAKRRGVNGSDEFERSMKLMRFAVQRGFEPGLVRKMLDISEQEQ